MISFHTIVVGAGPAGLACATRLAQAGKSVLLLERNRTIGPKACAGGIPPSTLSLGIPTSLLERRFQQQLIRTGWQRVLLTTPDPIVNTVNRRTLGQWMAAQAADAGVAIMTGTSARVVNPTEVATNRGSFRYQYLVGADGSASLVRRSLCLPTDKIGIGIHYQVPGYLQNMEWHLDPLLFRNGYAWIFPHRENASVGAYAARGSMAPRLLHEKLHRWATKYGIELGGLSPQAALVNFDYQGWRFGKTFLVGDAAGLASGLTGEGIYPALLSGEVAARTILDATYTDHRLAALLRRQCLHHRVLRLASRNRLRCTIVMETLVAALRNGMFRHSALELGGKPSFG